MGAPSQQQIDEAIADGLARGVDEGEVLAHLAGLERMSDGELAAVGVTIRPAPAPAPTPATDPAPAFAPVPVRARHDGWTVDRQRTFIAALAETGCVSEACGEVGITARSAYRLRAHPGAAAFRELGTMPSRSLRRGSPLWPGNAPSTAPPNDCSRMASWWPNGGGQAIAC